MVEKGVETQTEWTPYNRLNEKGENYKKRNREEKEEVERVGMPPPMSERHLGFLETTQHEKIFKQLIFNNRFE